MTHPFDEIAIDAGVAAHEACDDYSVQDLVGSILTAAWASLVERDKAYEARGTGRNKGHQIAIVRLPHTEG